jgi:hypothetical protein
MTSERAAKTFRYRRRVVSRDADRAAAAIDNLRICLLKLSKRANKADGESAGHSLETAARYLGLSLGNIDAARVLLK